MRMECGEDMEIGNYKIVKRKSPLMLRMKGAPGESYSPRLLSSGPCRLSAADSWGDALKATA